MRIDRPSGVDIWRSSLWASGVVTAALSLGVVGFLIAAPHRALPTLLVMSFQCAILLALWFGRDRARSASFWSVLAVFATTALLLVLTWKNQQIYVESGRRFELFAGNKLYALTIALVAPPLAWVGWTCLGAIGAVTVIQYFTFSEGTRFGLPAQEPWITAMYIVVAVVVYHFRIRSQIHRRRAAAAETRAEMLQKFAHLLINTQHLTNTPLQTVENSLAILRARTPDQKETFVRIERSLAKVRDVMHLLAQGNAHANWRQVEPPGSLADLEKRIKDLALEEDPHPVSDPRAG